MIAPMKKITLIGPKSKAKEVVHTLQDVGTVHIKESEISKKHVLDARLSEDLSFHEKRHAHIHSILSLFPHHTESEKLEIPQDQNLDQWLSDLLSKCHVLHHERQSLNDELSVLHAYENAVKSLASLLGPLQYSKNFESVGFIANKKDLSKANEMEKELSRAFPDKAMVFRKTINKEETGIVVAYPKNQLSVLRPIFNRYGLNELKLPSSLSSYPLQEAAQKMDKRLVEIPARIKAIDEEFETISRQNKSPLKKLLSSQEDEINVLKSFKNFGQTLKTFVVSGFIPSNKAEYLSNALKEKYKDEIYVEFEECHEAPTLLMNNKLVKPFELFINVLQPPKYGNIDPTPFFAFFFPIFFGLIMGDIGYGLIFMAIGLALFFKGKSVLIKDISKIILICSSYTIIFGYVFGEFFGDFLEKMGILHPLTTHIGSLEIEWNRMHNLLPLLILAIAIGVFHVFLGFTLKLIQSIKHKHGHETVEVIAIIISLIGLFALIGVLAQAVPDLAKIPSIAALVICIPLLVYMKGPLMLMELLSFVGNMLSYARLMAVGVASAYLAFVGNMLGGLMGNIILGAIVAILFHIINMVLAFSPTIQSARLHYVEFFSKFYEAGHQVYKPLSKKEANY
jgi:V/A-type H+-transporting ATPase subunit I